MQPIDYDAFRRTTWDERVAVFSALSAEEKAELVRSQIAGWLERHRADLTSAQIAVLEDAIRLVAAEHYTPEGRDAAREQVRDLEFRARAVLTAEQCIDALTMQWGLT